MSHQAPGKAESNARADPCYRAQGSVLMRRHYLEKIQLGCLWCRHKFCQLKGKRRAFRNSNFKPLSTLNLFSLAFANCLLLFLYKTLPRFLRLETVVGQSQETFARIRSKYKLKCCSCGPWWQRAERGEVGVGAVRSVVIASRRHSNRGSFICKQQTEQVASGSLSIGTL